MIFGICTSLCRRGSMYRDSYSDMGSGIGRVTIEYMVVIIKTLVYRRYKGLSGRDSRKIHLVNALDTKYTQSYSPVTAVDIV